MSSLFHFTYQSRIYFLFETRDVTFLFDNQIEEQMIFIIYNHSSYEFVIVIFQTLHMSQSLMIVILVLIEQMRKKGNLQVLEVNYQQPSLLLRIISQELAYILRAINLLQHEQQLMQQLLQYLILILYHQTNLTSYCLFEIVVFLLVINQIIMWIVEMNVLKSFQSHLSIHLE